MTILDQDTWTERLFDGGWITPAGGAFDVMEPATGKVLGRAGLATPADVAASADRAAESQREWAALPHPERAAVLRRAAGLWAEHADELGEWIVRETGSLRGKAAFELAVAEQECLEAAALPSRPYGDLLASAQPRLSFAERVPAGVVGVIAPFNFPLILSIRSVAPALALGNAVVLKPDPRAAVSGGVALARVFEEAGLPAGVLHVLPGAADVGQALVEHPRVPVISFTGSTGAGRVVGELAGRNLKRAHLELGGNSALVVLDDVAEGDLDAVVSNAAWGAWFHQGQVCMTTGRHLVHESVYDAYVDRLVAKADALPVGDPFTEDVAIGPIIDAGQHARVDGLVRATVGAGATLAAGGPGEGLFYRPAVLTGVRPDMPAYAEEVFGPVAPVVPFSTLDEAAALASGGAYGLSLGIFSGDGLRAYELARRIPTGIVHINDQTVDDEANAPFGGVHASGTGSRFGGAAANVEAFTETRWVTMQSAITPKPF